MNSKLIIGKLIRYHRTQKQMSQQQLASLLDVDRQYISKIENGQINLTLDYLDRILLHLKTEHIEIFNNHNAKLHS